MKLVNKSAVETSNVSEKVVTSPQYVLDNANCSRSVYKEAKILKCGFNMTSFGVNFSYSEGTGSDTNSPLVLFCLASCEPVECDACFNPKAFKQQFDTAFAAGQEMYADVVVNGRIKGVKSGFETKYTNVTIVTLLSIK